MQLAIAGQGHMLQAYLYHDAACCYAVPLIPDMKPQHAVFNARSQLQDQSDQ